MKRTGTAMNAECQRFFSPVSRYKTTVFDTCSCYLRSSFLPAAHPVRITKHTTKNFYSSMASSIFTNEVRRMQSRPGPSQATARQVARYPSFGIQRCLIWYLVPTFRGNPVIVNEIPVLLGYSAASLDILFPTQ